MISLFSFLFKPPAHHRASGQVGREKCTAVPSVVPKSHYCLPRIAANEGHQAPLGESAGPPCVVLSRPQTPVRQRLLTKERMRVCLWRSRFNGARTFLSAATRLVRSTPQYEWYISKPW